MRDKEKQRDRWGETLGKQSKTDGGKEKESYGEQETGRGQTGYTTERIDQRINR